MKTIKPGKLPSETLMRGTCHHCKADVECKKGEAQYHDDFREGGWWTVKCPTVGCEHNITVVAIQPQ